MLELNWQNNLMKQNFSLALNPSSPCHPHSPSHCFFLSFTALHKAVNSLFISYFCGLYCCFVGYHPVNVTRKVNFRSFWGEKKQSGYRMIPHAV